MLAVMRHHTHTVGTDGILVGAKPHPRGWGSFPEFIGGYARDRDLMSLEEAVAHATSRPAKRLGLTDRGTVVEGNWADLVVFDPTTIGSPASYDQPTLPPTGIFLVIVNGEIVVREGQRTDALPGRAIRRH
jgi:N-acyl-D-amino-acid deacylase